MLFRFFHEVKRTCQQILVHLSLIFTLLLHFISQKQTIAQSRFPVDYFTTPIDTPLKLSGGFAELRNNHLHGGLDFRTGGEEGCPIYAAADGYVGRIRVSGQGYGNCLYIIHPIGYTTVYGHLLTFEEPIRSWVNRRHNELQENELDLFLKKDELPVKKDQLVALSGNTGSSGGPHLHFEIRHTETEELINPLWFGLPVKDDVRPTFDCMEIVPIGPGSMVGGKASPHRLQFVQDSVGFWRVKKETIVKGACHVQVKVWDKHKDNELRQGIYKLLLVQGLDTLYSFKADRYAHAETRYANSVMDYEAKMLKNETFYRLFRSPGNHLRLLNSEIGNGILYPKPGENTQYRMIATDFSGNQSECSFTIMGSSVGAGGAGGAGDRRTASASGSPQRPEIVIQPNRAIKIERENVRFQLPAGTIYDTLNTRISIRSGPSGALSPEYSIGNARIPVHQYFPFSIRAPHVPSKLKSKVVAIGTNIKGVQNAHTGTWKGDWFESKTRQLGAFYLALDTIAPRIDKQGKLKSDTMNIGSTLQFSISDARSGIKNFHFYVGEFWNKLIWDAKSATLTARIDEHAPRGNQIACLVVIDAVGNEANLTIPVFIP